MKKLLQYKSSKKAKIAIASLAVFALVMAVVLSNGFMATGAGNISTTINKFSNSFVSVLTTIYNGLMAIVSVLACVIIGYCFITKMYSKNPRAIDEANQWMKRTAIAWLCFMLINVFIHIGIDIVQDMSANTIEPWT